MIELVGTPPVYPRLNDFLTLENFTDFTTGLVVYILVGIIVIGIYFVPTIIAKEDKGLIFLLNLCFGITGVAWIILLIWVLKREKK